MKISLFQGVMIGVFCIAAAIGLFVFATYKGTPKDAVGPVIIWGTLPKDGIQSMLMTLTPTNQALKSVSYVEKNPATLAGDLATAIATGGAPDLVLASQEELQVLSKFIAPIPPSTLSENTFVNSFVEEGGLFAAPQGAGYYGIPFLVDPLVLFSNRTSLSSAGVARPPATWEALVGLVPSLATYTPSRQIIRGLIGLGTYDNVKNARGILSTLFLQTGVPLSSYSTGGYLSADLGRSSTSSVPPGHAVLGFYTQFADPAKVSYTWNASLRDSEQMFLAGDLALYLGYASRASFLKAANPNLNFIVTAIPQPATATAKKVYGLAYALMIPRGAKNPSGGYSVAVLLSTPPVQSVAATNTGLAPAALTNLAAPPSDPTTAIAYAEALYAKGWLSPAPDSVDTIFSGMITNVISGRSSLDSALNSAEQSLTALLQQ